MPPEHQVPLSTVGNVTATRERTESVCLKAFPLDIVKQVCYRFGGQGYYKLEVDEDAKHAQVHFSFPRTLTTEEEAEVIRRFHNDLIDQDLRETVRKKTEIARNLILANAFADSALAENDS